ncbi:hypothetical protein B0T16DRAFT_60270 [Cercophora newfieldiana]|uniref:Secreted protein n=1 Tax=Cercophora newfieldiana TaxID=92897 RepID=A0AA39YRR5_9PEZI|nr:hypothetical protein B0T16DRAFT_60270 [Cercophora newfieldiana]
MSWFKFCALFLVPIRHSQWRLARSLEDGSDGLGWLQRIDRVDFPECRPHRRHSVIEAWNRVVYCISDVSRQSDFTIRPLFAQQIPARNKTVCRDNNNKNSPSVRLEVLLVA